VCNANLAIWANEVDIYIVIVIEIEIDVCNANLAIWAKEVDIYIVIVIEIK